MSSSSFAGAAGVPARPDLRPSSLVYGVRLMVLGGVLAFVYSVVTVVVGLPALRQRLETGEPTLSRGQIDLSLGVTIGLGVGFALLNAAVWFWMAWKNGQGRPWARVVATIFFLISTIAVAGSFFTPGNDTPAELAVSILFWLVGLGAIVFIWQDEASRYYHQATAGRHDAKARRYTGG